MERNKLNDKLINNAQFSAYYEHFLIIRCGSIHYKRRIFLFCFLHDLHVNSGPSKWLTDMIIHLTRYLVTVIQTFYLIDMDR